MISYSYCQNQFSCYNSVIVRLYKTKKKKKELTKGAVSRRSYFIPSTDIHEFSSSFSIFHCSLITRSINVDIQRS